MTILLIGYYGFSNAGDEAILASIVDQFRARVPSVRILVCSGNPEATRSQHGVEAIAWNRLSGIEHALRAADLVIVGGGGLFHDYWGADPDTLLTDRHWGIAYYAGCALLAALHRKPLALFAVGVGPLASEYGIRLTRAACEAASVVVVRDSASRDLLLSIGIPSEKIQVTADPAFCFVPQTSFQLRDFVPAAFPLQAPVLAVSVRNWTVGVNPAFVERELAAALELYLERSSGSIVLFPFQQIEGEHEDDRGISARIATLLAQSGGASHASRVAVAAGANTPGQIYGALRDCQLLLGMRLHALIFAATLGIPSVALSYDPKIDALQHPFRFDVRAFDAETLSQALRQALAAPAPGPVGDARNRALTTVPLVLQLLDHRAPSPQLSAGTLDLLRRGISAQIQASALARSGQADSEERIAAFDHENQVLRAALSTALLEGERAAQQHARESASQRAELGNFLDRYSANFESEWNAQRAQKTWQLMLLMRKAYALCFRGPKAVFFRWAATAAVGRWGSLKEFEPRFPAIANYVPDTFRATPAPANLVSANPRDTHSQRDKYDVVILAIIDFDFRFQRPQQIAAELARRGHRVFWISPSRFLPPGASEPFETVALRDHIWEVHLRCPPFDIYMGELEAAHLSAMAASLEALRDAWGIHENIVLAQLPFWRRLALRLRETLRSRLFYDCMDDWETFQNMGSFNVSEEKEFVRECDVLIVTGAELEAKYRAQNLEPLLIRNGADFAFFSQAPAVNLLPGVPHPIVGYFGAIADWIDLDLVHAVASRRPQYFFVLIGQVFGRDTASLEALPNVFLLGNKRYEDIPAYLRHFDACLIPFLLNQVTKATDPVKLYEYFSLGKPVIATDMAELKQCADLLYIGQGAEDFAAKIDAAVAESDIALRERRIAFAQANTWGARVDQIDAATRRLFPLVSILIVTYNSAEFVAACLDSIFKNTAYPHFEVLALDNASTDGTAAQLARYGRIRFIPQTENTGFAAGNNRAAQEAQGDYLVFLNVDTMVPPGWLFQLIGHVLRDASIGQICPVTNFAGNEAKINVTYRNAREMEAFASALACRNRGRTEEIRVAPLFCSLVPRAVWLRVGELDPSFGMGMFEDDDFSLRIRAAGLRVVTAEDCLVHHFGQGSFAKIPGEAYTALFEKNRKIMETKWNAPWKPHRTRPGVRPAFEEERFEPATFTAAGGEP